MGGYSKTGPFINGSSPGISSTFLNNVENVLSRPSGSTETGKYYLRGSSYTNTANMGNYIPSISRSATPSSVTIDEADEGHVAGSSYGIVTSNLTANGFLTYSSGTGTLTVWQVGGNWTINY